jgi:hypothetical protein
MMSLIAVVSGAAVGLVRLANRVVTGSEMLIWLVLAGIVGYPAVSLFILSYSKGNTLLASLAVCADEAPWSIIAGGLTLLLPVLVSQIFGRTPFALLRLRFSRLHHIEISGTQLDVADDGVGPLTVQQTMGADPRELLALYAERTSQLAQKIYNRAGVYLLVGVIISFVGLGFFWVRSRDMPTKVDYVEHFLNLMPGFGILFFIEFVAFFFLRQYRAAMDEFRHFDAIRRSREENLIIPKMFAENPNQVSTKDVLTVMNIYSTAGKLGKDETTEMLEARRMQRDESLVFEKLIDAVGALKDLRRSEKK